MTAPTEPHGSRAALERPRPSHEAWTVSGAESDLPGMALGVAARIKARWLDEPGTPGPAVDGPTKAECKGGTDAAPPGAAPSLPCLCSDNSDKEDEKADARHRARLARAVKGAVTLEMNIRHMCEVHGIERLGFLTLTVPRNLQFWKEADRREVNRRWDNFRRGWMGRRGIKIWVRVVEPTKSGRIHLHVLAVFAEDIRTGVDCNAVKAGDYRTAGPVLRSLWADLRRSLPEYGFGRHELMPIETNADGIASYVAKYLSKGLNGEREAGKPCRMRRVMYSQGWRVAWARWSWRVGRGALWRQWVRLAAIYLKFASFEDFHKHLGPRWAWMLLKAWRDYQEGEFLLDAEAYLVRERQRAEILRVPGRWQRLMVAR